MSHKAVLLITAGATSLISGCLATAPVPININDSSAPTYTARAVWHPRTQTTGPAKEQVKDGVEIQYTSTVGHDDQTLAAGEIMSAGGTTVTGPQQISHRVDISYAHLAYSGTAYMESYPAEMDVFMGLGQVRYDLHSDVTTAPPLTLQSSQTDYALTMGMGLRWRFLEKACAESRLVLLTQNPASYFLDTFGSGKQTDMVQFELALGYKPAKSLVLRGGYSWLNLAPKTTADSPLHFKVSGPLLGLDVFF